MARPSGDELLEILKRPNPDLEVAQSDINERGQKDADIDKEKLGQYLIELVRKDLMDRESFGFDKKRQYDIKSYFGLKDEFFSSWPWPHASNFPEPITPVMVDTGYTNIASAMFRNPLHTVSVIGIGPEDKVYAPKVSSFVNWQVGVESNMQEVQDSNIFRTILNGTGFVKTWIDIGSEFAIKNASIPIENILKPAYGEGCQKDNCDHIFQIVPLTENEKKFRETLRHNGKLVYDGMDNLVKGVNVSDADRELQRSLMSRVSGIDLERVESSDLYFWVEGHLTYYPPGSMRARELIVKFCLNNGYVNRVVDNKDIVRPYSDYYIYKLPGLAFHQSLPDKIRNVQEKANYTDKQVTDAADKAISSPAYIDENPGFNPQEHVRVPGGMYEVKKGTQIQYDQTNMSAIIERGNYVEKLWDRAERLTGFTDLFQGREPERRLTATTDKIRTAKAENRFKAILNRFGIGWGKTCDLIYYYDDRYVPRHKVARVLGSTEYKSVDELFPGKANAKLPEFGFNLNAKFNFKLAGKSQSEVDDENDIKLAFTDKILNTPFAQNLAVLYRALKVQADIIDFAEFERIVPKPPEADEISYEELMQRIESGEKDIQPSPYGEFTSQIIKIQLFMKTDKFKEMDDRKKSVLLSYLKRLQGAEMGAKLHQLNQMAQADPMVAQALDEIAEDVESGRLQIPGQVQPAGVPSEPVI